MRRAIAFLIVAIVLLAAGTGLAYYLKPAWFRPHVQPTAKVTAERLIDIPVLEPDDDPTGLVILFSDKGGITRRDRQMADALVDKGMVVLPVDLEKYRKQLNAADGECMYLGSDIENIAKEALRTIEGDDYFHPVVAGFGEGGTLAYAAVADAPVATMAGGVALDAAKSLNTPLPTCPGAVTTPDPAGGFSYAIDADLPNPFTFVTAFPVGASGKAPGKEIKADEVDLKGSSERFDATVDAIVAIAAKDSASNELPIQDIPATTTPFAVALFFSGDGGWRDLDRQIGDEMSTQGMHVVGIDTLRYFWSERTPQELADDTVAIIDRADPTGKLPVAIYGYSFGADTFPFAWNLLPGRIQDRIKFVALLGSEHLTTFQVTIEGWLGMGGDHPVGPAIATIPPERVLCVYGEEEDDTACTEPILSKVEKMKTEGGHHFDEDYPALAAKLLVEFKERLK